MNTLLGLDDIGPVSYFNVLLRHPWPALAVFALACVPAACALVIYRRERALSRGKRITLGIIRAVVMALVVVMLFEPVLSIEAVVKLPKTILVLLDTSESMARRDTRKTEAELKDAALALGAISFDKAGEPLPETARVQASTASRIEIARGLLGHPEVAPRKLFADDYKLRYFGFGDSLRPAEGEGEVMPDTLRTAKADAKSTRLGSAVEEAVSRYGSQSVAGVIILTDGASNAGLEPAAVATRMTELDPAVPIFPIGIGLPRPMDVGLRGLIVQDTLFERDRVPVRVRIVSSGCTGRTVNLIASLDGRKVAGKAVLLTGRPQFEEFSFIPETRSGSTKLEVVVSTLPGEASTDNNRVSKTLTVINEKINVLYVEGKPRWEYRYLRRVLLRDHRLNVKFLLTEGDRDLAEASEQYLLDFPEEAAAAFHFDLVIMGDVPASYFSKAQLSRIEELVREHGGSFLMLAGEHHAPASYIGSPIENVLPVRLRVEGARDVDDTVYPVITPDGAAGSVMRVDTPDDRNQEVWSRVRPLYHLPLLEGAKPGATVLARASRAFARGEEYPLIAWQRYGTGKSLFVGTDQLWRLRLKRGDEYHARFWGQAIRFLTLSRLLGENKRVHLETDRKDCRTGERVRISANVLDESFEPIRADSYKVYLEMIDPKQPASELRLEPNDRIKGLYEGVFRPEHAGRYRLTAAPAEQEWANAAEFTVEDAPLEGLEPAMQEQTLRRMAELSGGKYFTIGELPMLRDAIAGEQRTTVIRREKELWDQPIVFALLLVLLGIEWFVRRLSDVI